MRAGVLRAAIELALAVAAGWACCVAWSHVSTMVLVAPIIDGEPETWSTRYDPRAMLLALSLAAAAGVLAVVGFGRMVRVIRGGHGAVW